MMVILKDTEAWVSGFESVIEKWLEDILGECFFLAIKYFRKSSKIIKIEKKTKKKSSLLLHSQPISQELN